MDLYEMLELLGKRVQHGLNQLPAYAALQTYAVVMVCTAINPWVGMASYITIVGILAYLSKKVAKEIENV